MLQSDNYERGLEMKKAKALQGAMILLGFAVFAAMTIGITTGDSQSSGGTRATVRFDHVHFMVKDLDKALRSYEKLLGLTPSGQGGFRRDTEASRIGMLPMQGGRIEMIELGASATGRMPRFAKEHGEGVGGLSIFLEDFDKEIATLKKKGVAVQVTNPPAAKDVKYPLRLGWVEADQGHGVWLEIVDVKTVPPYDKDWDVAQFAAPSRLFVKRLGLPGYDSCFASIGHGFRYPTRN
jgi:catechol 2,3-dioxygenase-like lactoylglutathione lyase family enzyme